VAFLGYLGVLWPQVAEHQLLGALTGVALVWLLTVTNLLGARQSGLVKVVTTVLTPRFGCHESSPHPVFACARPKGTT
jgi:amino acid transporter